MDATKRMNELNPAIMSESANKTKNRLLREFELSWAGRRSMRIVKHGRIPQHIALIMDGNRRYAREHQRSVFEGHVQGFEKLAEILFWCREMGIREVTAYAFSIENFKRSQGEVDALMALAEGKFRELLENRAKLEEEGICIRILGNTAYLPVSLQQVCAELILATKHHNRRILNIALSYTARDEMCTAITDLLKGAEEGIIDEDHFSEQLLSSAMYSCYSPDPELLVRTSGEGRLSDFLLWQIGYSVVEFIPSLWPDLNLWAFLATIVNYQCHARKIENCINQGKNTSKSQHAGNERKVDAQFQVFINHKKTARLQNDSLGHAVQQMWTHDS